eukprot:12819748-Ditylum_brightwellii.AAC.1
MEARGTMKACVFESDEECPDLLALFIHDTKPVQFLFMKSISIIWVTNEKDAFNINTNTVEMMDKIM